MFRLRKQSVNENQPSPSQFTSSLSSGNASIIKPQYHENKVEQVQEEDDYNTEEMMKEAIDLQASSELPAELTIESMSAVIAAAVQMSTSGGNPSSLELGSASIVKTPTSPPLSPKRRFSTRIFSWRKSTPASEITIPTSDSTLTVSSDDSLDSPRSSSTWPKTPDDDGRDELVYRGIQIKEIKTTLKTLVISDEVAHPMPKVNLERPGFARINY
jgi:hypothetical protein